MILLSIIILLEIIIIIYLISFTRKFLYFVESFANDFSKIKSMAARKTIQDHNQKMR